MALRSSALKQVNIGEFAGIVPCRLKILQFGQGIYNYCYLKKDEADPKLKA